MRFTSPALSFTRGALFCVALAACDATPKGREPRAPEPQRLAAVSVRVDLPAGGTPSVSVLAYRAAAVGIASSDVLGLVDPLVASPPEQGCELRDMADAARAVRLQGSTLELEEIGLLSVDAILGPAAPNAPTLSLLPRVFTDYGAGVSGAISEAGPIEVGSIRRSLAFVGRNPAATAARVEYALPTEALSLSAADGTALMSPLSHGSGDLVLSLTGPARSFVEARPFGSTLMVSCAPQGGQGRIVIPAELVSRLARAGGRVPVSFDAVWRETRGAEFSGRPIRLALEIRASTALELKP
jgi:hypothetical protein